MRAMERVVFYATIRIVASWRTFVSESAADRSAPETGSMD
jgi:hypothetical protein